MICEDNINTGSLYFCCMVFLPLGLSFNNVFWSAPHADWTSVKAWNGEEIEPDQLINF